MKKYYLTLNEDGSDTHICLYQEYNDRKQKVLVEFTEIEKRDRAIETLKKQRNNYVESYASKPWEDIEDLDKEIEGLLK